MRPDIDAPDCFSRLLSSLQPRKIGHPGFVDPMIEPLPTPLPAPTHAPDQEPVGLTLAFQTATLADIHFGAANVTPKPERTISPSGMSEEARRELIARQRSALYGEGPFAQAGGYVDETGTPRPGMPSSIRGGSPPAYEAGPQPPNEPLSAGPRDRASNNVSPASNPPGNRGPLEQTSRTSNSSPGGENGKAIAAKTVAPIGTRPSAPSSQGPSNPTLQRQSTTPLPSPLNQSYHAPGAGEAVSSGGPSNPTSAGAEAPVGLGSWPQRGQPWGPKAQTSVWG